MYKQLDRFASQQTNYHHVLVICSRESRQHEQISFTKFRAQSHIVSSKAKGFNYQPFLYDTVRSFCLLADDISRWCISCRSILAPFKSHSISSILISVRRSKSRWPFFISFLFLHCFHRARDMSDTHILSIWRQKDLIVYRNLW